MFYSLFLKVVVIYGPSFPSVRVFGEDDINSKWQQWLFPDGEIWDDFSFSPLLIITWQSYIIKYIVFLAIKIKYMHLTPCRSLQTKQEKRVCLFFRALELHSLKVRFGALAQNSLPCAHHGSSRCREHHRAGLRRAPQLLGGSPQSCWRACSLSQFVRELQKAFLFQQLRHLGQKWCCQEPGPQWHPNFPFINLLLAARVRLASPLVITTVPPHPGEMVPGSGGERQKTIVNAMCDAFYFS